jgi:hypothetical protein
VLLLLIFLNFLIVGGWERGGGEVLTIHHVDGPKVPFVFMERVFVSNEAAEYDELCRFWIALQSSALIGPSKTQAGIGGCPIVVPIVPVLCIVNWPCFTF